jgi:glucose-6-phosphate 1-dehydrogenase
MIEQRADATAASRNLKPAPSCVMVIFGAAGDLAGRLIMPALCHLAEAGLLDDGFRVLGVDRQGGDDAAYRDRVGKRLRDGQAEPVGWPWLSQRLCYQPADFDADSSFATLASRLERLGGGNAVFYLAVPPRLFGGVADRLAAAGLVRESRRRYRRVVIEKPFGADLASAGALNAQLLNVLDERQLYRIDHFLGKETVRNILVARFANGVFEPIWNQLHIDHVQITAAETVGVEDRGASYDQTGALRDMVPSHLLQLLALTAMEPPTSLEAAAVRAEKTRVLAAIRPLSAPQAHACSVRGQYRPGCAAGRRVADYRREPKVAARSRTETYVALKLAIDNPRWAGVPFYLRTGKAMGARDTEIAIRFKAVAPPLFRSPDAGAAGANSLILQIQPQEAICLQMQAKSPGPDMRLRQVQMDFRYADHFGPLTSSGYETLIYDCLVGDQALFRGASDIERSWRAVQPFLDAWSHGGRVYGYPGGSDGPAAARALLAREGRSWRPVGR